MANLLDSIRNLLPLPLIGQTAAALDETENSVARAVNSLVPALLAGLLQKTGDAREMGQLFRLLQKFKPVQDEPKDAAGRFTTALFGAKMPVLIHGVAAFSGAKTSSVSALLELVEPLVLRGLHEQIVGQNLDTAGVSQLLQNERDNILPALPGSLVAMLNLADNTGEITNPAAENLDWLWPLLLLLGLGGGILYLLRH